MTGINCCCAQIQSCWEDPEATLRKVQPFINQATRENADIITFPEQFPTGWDPTAESHCENLDGPIVSAIQKLAEENGIAILGSFRERTSGLPRNTSVAIGANGEILGTYAKIHPFSPAHEDQHFSSGTDVATFSLKSVKLGIAICYDLRFPELFHIYAQEKVHGVLVPAAWPALRQHHWEIFIRSRALDNQMYVTGINTTGVTPVDTYQGGSMAVDPNGNVIHHSGSDEEISFFHIDPNLVEVTRKNSRVSTDRKSSLYRKFFLQ